MARSPCCITKGSEGRENVLCVVPLCSSLYCVVRCKTCIANGTGPIAKLPHGLMQILQPPGGRQVTRGEGVSPEGKRKGDAAYS
ncbi:hypothetical protein PAXRUDRAFT_332325 [Paxillus rubicundulus Ve08.2h10]|uniref:Uncharacterized protein n=1 Tax=Paxillus rubicundulus Ve08.2h10 TaxID=930991 RepID=A0A0D0DMX6_9AGAM|nr:hypothetical protein PAXRUDRAFT_332325 [Paxillus rubicundulus Ve08.2h10]